MPAHTKLKIRTGSQVVDRQKALKESLLKLEAAEHTHEDGETHSHSHEDGESHSHSRSLHAAGPDEHPVIHDGIWGLNVSTGRPSGHGMELCLSSCS